MVGQRVLWLNLSTKSVKDKAHFRDQPVDPKGLFRPAVSTMQQRFEAKKREAFRSLMPCRAPKPMQRQATRFPTFTQSGAAGAQSFWQGPRRGNRSLQRQGESRMTRKNNLSPGNESPALRWRPNPLLPFIARDRNKPLKFQRYNAKVWERIFSFS